MKDCNHETEIVTREYICEKCWKLVMAKKYGEYDTIKEMKLDLDETK